MNPSVASSNDVYANIATLDEALLRALVERLELRAADQQQRAMREAYLSEIALPEHAHVLEVGSGTGAVVRELAGHPRVEQIVGIDPSSFSSRGHASSAPSARMRASRSPMAASCRSRMLASTP